MRGCRSAVGDPIPPTGSKEIVPAVGGVVVIAPVTTRTRAANCTGVNVSDVVENNSDTTTRNYVRSTIRNSFDNSSGFPFGR
jgi:hypothetical protein